MKRNDGNHPFHPFTPLNLNTALENGTPLEKEIPILEIIRFFQVNHLFNLGGVNFFSGFQVRWRTTVKRIYIYPLKGLLSIKVG